MAGKKPVTNFLNEEERAMLTPAAAQLSAHDLWSLAKGKFLHRSYDDDAPAMTEKAQDLSWEDIRSIGRAFRAQAKRRHAG